MIRTVLAALSLAAVPAGAFAFNDADTLAEACIEAGNDAADCRCAAGKFAEELTETEMAFMLDATAAGEDDPAAIMAIAAEHGMTMEDMMAMGQTMQELAPVIREDCGIEESESAG